MINTRIRLTDNTRQVSISVLQAALVDALNLRLAVKQAHWTIRGRRFQQLHELFDSFVEPLDGNIDEIAERIADAWRHGRRPRDHNFTREPSRPLSAGRR